MTARAEFSLRNIAPLTRDTAGLAAVLMMVFGWSASALGATSHTSNCQQISESLKSLDTPSVELSITLVDLPDNDVELGLLETDEPVRTMESVLDSTAPLLFLTPRVASMLREVFDDVSSSVVSDEKAVDATNASARSTRISTVPPVAEGNSDQSLLPNLEETKPSTPVRIIPRFQRPMYRTDI